MLGLAMVLQPQYSLRLTVPIPAGFAWDQARFGFDFAKVGARFQADVDPRDLVDPAIWTGTAFHVDAGGDDANSGLGAAEGDFSAAKQSIYAAFVAGNATNAPYRVLVNTGQYEGGAFTRNGNDEPTRPVAVLAYGGRVKYRTGPFDVSWSDVGRTFSAAVSSVRRVFRTDVLTPEGLYSELSGVADVATCAATPDSWVLDGSVVHVNIGGAPAAGDIALIRSFHGARFMDHDDDFTSKGSISRAASRAGCILTKVLRETSSVSTARSAIVRRPIRQRRKTRSGSGARTVWWRFSPVTRVTGPRTGGHFMTMARWGCMFCCKTVVRRATGLMTRHR